MPRPIDELINVTEPGWPTVDEWIKTAIRPVEVLPAEQRAARDTLYGIQVTTRSPMGAIAYSTGGIVVDGGWLRILGAGHARLPRSLAAWNGCKSPGASTRLPGCILIADDVLGGFYALNGDAFPAKPGTIQYLPPDKLEWEDMEMTYSQFVWWAFNGQLDLFYKNWRWSGWEKEVANVRGDQGLSVYPFLWAETTTIGERSRRPVPIEELWHLHVFDFPKQLGLPYPQVG